MNATKPLVLASPAPVPLDVICRWLRRAAALGRPVRISPLLAQRIAAELEERQ
jgi:hypothetical protein